MIEFLIDHPSLQVVLSIFILVCTATTVIRVNRTEDILWLTHSIRSLPRRVLKILKKQADEPACE